MTKLIVCSMKDLGAQTFGRPIFVPHANVAVRNFMDEVNRPGTSDQINNLYSHPDDFELYELGHFDDATGELVSHDVPVLLSQAKHIRQLV